MTTLPPSSDTTIPPHVSQTSKQEFTHRTFDQVKNPAPRYGSIREKKVNPDLQEEREKRNFDQRELTQLIYGAMYERHREYADLVARDKNLQSNLEFYDMSREELLERSMRVVNYIAKSPELVRFHQSKSLTTNLADYFQGQVGIILVCAHLCSL